MLILNRTANAIKEMYERTSKIASLYSLPIPETIQDCLNLYNVFSRFHPGIFSDEMQLALNNYLKDYRSFSRYFDLHYWTDSSKLRSVYRQGSRPVAAEVAPF